jgi:hypothetical protein
MNYEAKIQADLCTLLLWLCVVYSIYKVIF